MISRRDFLTRGVVAAAGAAALPRILRAEASRGFSGLRESLAKLEKSCGGRLGVSVIDTATGERGGYRADERFPMCSTHKMLLAAAVLKRVDAGQEHLDRAIAVPAKALVHYSPVTGEHAGGEMTVADLCDAMLTLSDNTGANLLLETIGGPQGYTRFARSIGDPVTRLDRTETSLNESLPGDPRDTTTPAAMVQDMRKLLLGDVLSTDSRQRLLQWMESNKTGDHSLRAGLPHDWLVGDKTGSNLSTTTNDIAIVFPVESHASKRSLHGAPRSNEAPRSNGMPAVLIAAYLTECAGPEERRDAVLADVGRMVAAAVGLPEADARKRLSISDF